MAELPAKILVVDDEAKNVRLLEALLAPHGYSVIKAHNGAEALEQVARWRPDLILLDVMMPTMDGFEVCQVLKDDPETRLIPIVMMTALGQVENRIKGIEAGADDFLTKPVHRDELMARIRTSLRLKQAIENRMRLLQAIRDQLAKFVPASVQRAIEANPEAPDLRKEERDLSVIFADISDYGRLSEAVSREQMNFILELYFSTFLEIIHANGGEVSETLGDGLMAIFTGTSDTEHALKAVAAALEILRSAAELNEKLPAQLRFSADEDFEPIEMHIGVNSGLALLGPMQLEGVSGTYWTYTATGSTINVAARLAALAERTTVLVSGETAGRIAGAFATRCIGSRRLKNVRDEVVVYQVIERRAASEDVT